MIRRGTTQDAHKISHLWVEMVREMRPEWSPNPSLWREHFYRSMTNGNYFVWVSENGGGKIDGFIDYFLFQEPSTNKLHAVGQHFYMKPEHRHGKVAYELYNTAINDAKGKGARVLELFCFETELPKWKRRGYTPTRYLVRQEVASV